MKKCLDYFNQGSAWVVDMDIEKFFDSVSRERLMEILSRDLHDERVLRLILAFLNSGSIENGLPVRTSAGISQGGPLSPLLANVMLNELDQELIARNEKFVRYADDMLIFCRNKSSAYQALKHIMPFINENLFLNINHDKTIIAHASQIKFLGYGFFRTLEGFGLRIHEDSIAKLRSRIKGLADREQQEQYFTSWLTHYRLADTNKFLDDLNFSPI